MIAVKNISLEVIKLEKQQKRIFPKREEIVNEDSEVLKKIKENKLLKIAEEEI